MAAGEESVSTREPSSDERGAVRIRGHTLLCLQGFRGEGYSPDFVQSMAAIHRELAAEPDRVVEVVEAPDAVCGACPHLVSSGCSLNGSDSERGMQAQDQHVLGLLGLQPGTKVRWREVLERIRASVKGSDLPEICGSCRWLPLGYCKEGINRLRNGDGEGSGGS
jgi:hypothetical protein